MCLWNKSALRWAYWDSKSTSYFEEGFSVSCFTKWPSRSLQRKGNKLIDFHRQTRVGSRIWAELLADIGRAILLPFSSFLVPRLCLEKVSLLTGSCDNFYCFLSWIVTNAVFFFFLLAIIATCRKITGVTLPFHLSGNFSWPMHFLFHARRGLIYGFCLCSECSLKEYIY